MDIGDEDNIPSPDAGPAKLGETIGQYRLMSVLGSGGTACVYLAEHVLLGRKVAIKVLVAEVATDQSYLARFLHEAKVVNDVRHPNIVDISNFISTDDPRRVALVMELLEGDALDAYLEQHKQLSVPQALNACAQIASALTVVHEVGVIHRDLKPGNIIVIAPPQSDFSDVPSIKILDFGIAKNIGDDSDGHITTVGIVLGTPQYMAPEQITGNPSLPQTDVYALAELLYEMLTGLPAFEGSRIEIFRAKLSTKSRDLPIPIDIEGSELLRPFLSSCLETKPENRPSLPEFVEVLTQLQGRAPEASVVAPSPEVPKENDTSSPPVEALATPFSETAPLTDKQAAEILPPTTTVKRRPIVFFLAIIFVGVVLAWVASRSSPSIPEQAQQTEPKAVAESATVTVTADAPPLKVESDARSASSSSAPTQPSLSNGTRTDVGVTRPTKPSTKEPKAEETSVPDRSNPPGGPMNKREMPTW